MTRTREDVALLVLRLSGLLLAANHGWGKVSALAAGEMRFVEGVTELGFPAPLLFAWAAALSELGGGLCVALGLWTRAAAALAAITMAVAAFWRHHALQQVLASTGLVSVSRETLGEWGRPELALVYLVAFATLVLTGPGRFALGRAFGHGRRS